ncbi:hypothetical protein AB0K51_30495 [Kitasatospora sp. NPDC049285]|uniref:hypothetical protein n=1 Tax=Kitasatospora sp. NPDC049285 TaxID=3157096 RepID=UPI003420717B
MADDKYLTHQETAALSPAEALALAGRARAAARRPAPLPWWYGPGIGASFAAYGAALGQSFRHQWQWLIPLCALGLVVVLAVIVRVAARASGVARLAERGLPPHTFPALGAVVLVAAVAGLATWLVSGDQRWAITAAGAAGGLALWGVISLINRQVKEQTMSSEQ